MSSMAQHRYRQGKVKREHTIIEGLLPLLTSIAELPEVNSIIPGRINQRSRTGETGLFFQYQTETGLKLLGRSKLAVQEVFVVTGQPQAVLEALVTRSLVKSPGNGRSPGAKKAEGVKHSGTEDTKDAGGTGGAGDTGEAGDSGEMEKGKVPREAGAPTSRVDTSGAPPRRTNTQRNRPRAKRGGPTTKRADRAQQLSAQDAAQSAVVENSSTQGAPQSALRKENGGSTPFREEPPPETERVEPKLWNQLLKLHHELLRLEKELTKELHEEPHADTAGERNPPTRPPG